MSSTQRARTPLISAVLLAFALSACSGSHGKKPGDDDSDAAMPGDGDGDLEDAGPSGPPDQDGDKIPDEDDNCPNAANESQVDFDGDLAGDACDNCVRLANFDQADKDTNGVGDACEKGGVFGSGDEDGDGVANGADPPDNCLFVANPDQADTDGDKVGNACDNCVLTANTDQVDADENGVGDACADSEDPGKDDDGDNTPDGVDNCPGKANPTQKDTDKDSIGDDCDNCPDSANYSQTDTDMDGEGDGCEGENLPPAGDEDGDGISNQDDSCDLVDNAGTDKDKDSIDDACDNCVDVANADQAGPKDGPNTGTACQQAPTADDDGDGKTNIADNCPTAKNADQKDTDKDRRGDACDNCVRVANFPQVDTDGDKIGDACQDSVTDTDNDGKVDGSDNCIKTANPDQADADGDKIGDLCDNCKSVANISQNDADGDKKGDACDDNDLPAAETCAAGKTNASPIAPNLFFLVDSSGSMDQDACDSSASCTCSGTDDGCNGPNNARVPEREKAWEDAVDVLKTEIATADYNIGAAQFSGTTDGEETNCNAQPDPFASSAPAALAMRVGTGGASAFDTATNITPQGGTPTPAALAGTLDPNHDNNFSDARYILASDSAAQDALRAKAVVLVTDGLPTQCPGDGRNTGDDELHAVVDQMRRIASQPGKKVRVFVLGFDIGEEDNFQLFANAGDPNHAGPFYFCNGSHAVPCICHPTDNGANNQPNGCTDFDDVPETDWFVVSNTASIVDAVRSIASSTVSCGLPLTANGANGIADPSVARVRFITSAANKLLTKGTDYDITSTAITLKGQACTNLQTAVANDPNARVEVEMGCACEPSAEVCGDAKDNDCDGTADEDCGESLICGGTPAPPPEDCPMSCPNIGPEVCDMKDNDCDGVIDEGCGTMCESPTLEYCDGTDNDCDGSTDEECPVCGPEVCDGRDNDCDMMVDEGCGDPPCTPFTEICDMKDNDCDGVADDMCVMCMDPSNEICDGADNDCDGSTDEGCGGPVIK